VRDDNKKSGGAEAFSGAGLCFGGLFFAALRGRRGFERVEQASADGGDLVDGCVEGVFVALEGLLKPLIFRTNWREALRISWSVTGGSKLKRFLMFRHMLEL